mgnify:CR=1 FL=1
MAYLDGNITKIRTCGEDILTLSEDFDGIIDEMIQVIDNIKIDEAWTGEDADAYIPKAKLEIEALKKVSESTKQLGHVYINTADAWTSFMKGNNTNE